MSATPENTPSAPPPIGQMIAQFRASRNHSLQDLSNLSGVSKGMISQIENGQVNPTLAVVWKLASGLGVRLQDLLDEPDANKPGIEFIYLTKENCPTLTSPGHGYEVQILNTTDMVETVELYLVRFMPNGEMTSAPHVTGTMETVTVFQGEVEVDVDGARHRVKSHETARYSADVPHCLRCAGDKEALAYLAVKFPAPNQAALPVP